MCLVAALVDHELPEATIGASGAEVAEVGGEHRQAR